MCAAALACCYGAATCILGLTKLQEHALHHTGRTRRSAHLLLRRRALPRRRGRRLARRVRVARRLLPRLRERGLVPRRRGRELVLPLLPLSRERVARRLRVDAAGCLGGLRVMKLGLCSRQLCLRTKRMREGTWALFSLPRRRCWDVAKHYVQLEVPAQPVLLAGLQGLLQAML